MGSLKSQGGFNTRTTGEVFLVIFVVGMMICFVNEYPYICSFILVISKYNNVILFCPLLSHHGDNTVCSISFHSKYLWRKIKCWHTKLIRAIIEKKIYATCIRNKIDINLNKKFHLYSTRTDHFNYFIIRVMSV